MFVSFKSTSFGLLRWQWKPIAVYAIISSTVVYLHSYLGIEEFVLPGLPLTVVGAAIGIFVAFRTSAAYERWWEGRKLWGRMVNSSRMICTQVTSYVGGEERGAAERIVRRHINYVHALRVILRHQNLLEDEPWMRTCIDDPEEIAGQSNPTHALLQRQSESLTVLNDEGVLDARRLQSLDRTIAELLDVQGGCERIRNTPFPQSYGFIAERMILAYGMLLPFAIVEHLDWLTVPITILVCLSFELVSEVGRVLENPFTMFWPALPLSNLSGTIEVNLLERIGDEELPEIPGVDERGIMM